MSPKLLLIAGIFFASMACGLPAADGADATFELRYRFSDGQELNYRIADQRRIDIHVAEASDTVRHSSDALRRHRVVEIDEDGNSRIEITILNVRMTAESGGETVVFNNQSDDAPPAAFQGVAETIGRPFGIVTVSARGDVVGTELLLEGQSAEQFDTAQRDFLPILPESPVAVGDTWRDPFEAAVLVAPDQQLQKLVRLERIYSLESVEDGIASISVRTVVLSPIGDAFQNGQLIQRTTHGTIQLDLERGLLIDRSVSLDNTVVGFQGPQTSLSVEGSHQDALVPVADLAAEDPAAAATR